MRKLTIKQEKFCQVYIETGNASAAYRLSYCAENMTKKTISEAASRLFSNSNVAAKIAALNLRSQKRNDVTVETLTAELDATLSLAFKKGQSGAAVAATLGKAKLHGLLIERKQISGNLTIDVIKQQLFGD